MYLSSENTIPPLFLHSSSTLQDVHSLPYYTKYVLIQDWHHNCYLFYQVPVYIGIQNKGGTNHGLHYDRRASGVGKFYYRATLGFVKRKTDAPVRVLQLAFYDEESGRAVVSSLIGNPETVRKNEEALRELVFSVACRSPQLSLL